MGREANSGPLLDEAAARTPAVRPGPDARGNISMKQAYGFLKRFLNYTIGGGLLMAIGLLGCALIGAACHSWLLGIGLVVGSQGGIAFYLGRETSMGWVLSAAVAMWLGVAADAIWHPVPHATLNVPTGGDILTISLIVAAPVLCHLVLVSLFAYLGNRAAARTGRQVTVVNK